MDFDIVICVGPNDQEMVHSQIEYTKKNIIGYRKIFLIAAKPKDLLPMQSDLVTVVDESIFPFTKKDVEARIPINNSVRRKRPFGWFLQQLLKLYAPFYIKNILPTYLVIDCDTHFLRPTQFLSFSDSSFASSNNNSANSNNDKNNKKYLFVATKGTRTAIAYFGHMFRLCPLLKRYHESVHSICHHMIFEKRYIQELFDLVETYHFKQTSEKKQFWELFLEAVDFQNYASEYEIYFNYMFVFHPDKVQLRFLNWADVSSIDYVNHRELFQGLDFASCHWYIKDPAFKSQTKCLPNEFYDTFPNF